MSRCVSGFVVLAAIVFAGPVASASAATDYALFGDAHVVAPGEKSAHSLEATSSGPRAFGGADLAIPAGMRLSQLQTLSTDYMFTEGSCRLGSPRVSVSVTDGTIDRSIYFRLGPPPDYTGCVPKVWSATANLADPSRGVDASQLPGGSANDSFGAAQSRYGGFTIKGVALIADAPHQTVRFDNARFNETGYTFEPPATCRPGLGQILSDLLHANLCRFFG